MFPGMHTILVSTARGLVMGHQEARINCFNDVRLTNSLIHRFVLINELRLID